MVMPFRPLRETEEWKRGHTGELLVARWLMRRGWYVVPSYDYSGEDGFKAPRMHGLRDGFVLPDLDVSKDGQRLWAEVKTKRVPTLHRITGRMEHGIAINHWKAYRRVQQESGCDVWLVIYEELARRLVVGRLSALEKNARFYQGDKMDRSGMVFFLRDDFKPLPVST